MSTFRIVKTKNFSVISNTILCDKRLSWEARGVAAYVLTKPNGWTINTSQLVKEATGGRDRMLRIMQELEENGYLVRKNVKGPDGRFVYEQEFFEEPQAIESGFAGGGEAYSGKALTLLKTVDIKEFSKENLAPPKPRQRKTALINFQQREWEDGALWLRKFLLEEQDTFTSQSARRLLDNYGWWDALNDSVGGVVDLDFLRIEFAKMKRWMIRNPTKCPTESNVLRFVEHWLDTAVVRKTQGFGKEVS